MSEVSGTSPSTLSTIWPTHWVLAQQNSFLRNTPNVSRKIPREFLKRIEGVTNKRARLVLDRIVQYGSVSTEELRDVGYHHPPRARMDALDLGFPIKTTRVRSSTGKSIAAYSFDLTKPLCETRSGRANMPKKRRGEIIAQAGRCQICGATHDLQVDHRVPFQVAGESQEGQKDAYMVLDGSCNRRKSWACEHCENFTNLRRVAICQSCYWGNPENHEHVAMQQMRRVDIVWQGSDTVQFDRFRKVCKRTGVEPAAAIKKLTSSLK